VENKNVSQYLRLYAEDDARQIVLPSMLAQFRNVVVVPCMAEADGLPSLLSSLERAAQAPDCGPALAIICVNGREDSPEWVNENNLQCFRLFAGRSPLHEMHPDTGRVQFFAGDALSLIVVDRARPGRRFCSKDGVGLARKIGCDLALRLWSEHRVTGDWIFNTDGDAEVPRDYFNVPKSIRVSQVGLTLPFVHIPVAKVSEQTTGMFQLVTVQQAIKLYERFLFYYEEGLRHAGSSYAFQTVGSSMAFRFDAYAAVRGFPKKNAGEDFYLLNKLAKVGEIGCKSGDPIRLSGRVSSRVPFGTGASVIKIAEIISTGGSFTVYDPRSFDILKIWIGAQMEFSHDRDLSKMMSAVSQMLTNRFGAEAGSRFGMLITESGWETVAAQLLERCKTPQNLQRQIAVWMDAFRTLKWIHQIRDHIYPEIAVGTVEEFPVF
jgi:hypothetical protein